MELAKKWPIRLDIVVETDMIFDKAQSGQKNYNSVKTASNATDAIISQTKALYFDTKEKLDRWVNAIDWILD